MKKTSANQIISLVLSKGWEIIYLDYNNQYSQMLVKCDNGHEFKMFYKRIKSGSKCPFCSGKRLSLEHAQNTAKSRGGECLSKEYISNREKMRWRCVCGYEWEATYTDVYNHKSWCPNCGGGLSERICRKYIEEIFKDKFPKKRPQWLISKNGTRLELDCYNQDLNIALEHQGRQHTEINYFHKNINSLVELKERDIQKQIICDKFGVKLIIIPELFFFTKIEDLPGVMEKELKRLNINIPDRFYTIKIKDITFCSDKIIECIEKAESKGGKLLSTIYLNGTSPLLWECKNKHQWYAAPNNIIYNNHWCVICFRENTDWTNIPRNKDKFGRFCSSKKDNCIAACLPIKYCIENAKKVAIDRGGECLSEKYISTNKKLIWQCSEGHIWEANLKNVMTNGSWCPECYNARRRKNKLPT